MRNFTLLLLLLVLCAMTFSKDLRKRRSYSSENTVEWEALLRAIGDGKVDLNELHKDDARNPNRRWWVMLPIFGAGGMLGKK